MLTDEAKKEYVASAGTECPYEDCHSQDIFVDEAFDYEGSCQTIVCKNCGRRWREVFELVGIEEEE